jgi:iron complex outermembrane receptor protein
VGPVAWHLDGLLRRTRNYEIPPGGRQKGTFADAFSGSGGAAYIFEDGSRFGASFTRFESEYGIPEEDEKAEIDMHSNRVRFEGDWNSPVPGIAQVRLRGLWSDYEHEEKVDGVVGQTFDNDQFDGRLEWVHGDVLGFVGAAGFTGSTRDLKAGGEAAEFLAPTDTNSGAFYVFEERELLDSLVTELGFRVEGSVVEGTPFGDTQRVDKSFTPVSGSAGLVYSPNEQWSVGLIGAASQRAPAESELFARGPHESTETFEIGSPGLDEETSYTAEMRVTFRNECARVEVAGFVTRYDDYIFAQLTGVTVNEDGDVVPPTDPDALDQLFYRDRDALFAGFEVSSEVDLFEALWGTWGIEGQFDYVRARFTSGSDRNLPRITPIRWGSHLTYRGDLVRARFGFLRTEKQGDSSNFDSSTGSFTFLDAALFVRVTPLGERVPVEIGIQGTNLTDEKGRNHVSFQADEVLLPGRNIRGTVRVDF